MDRLGSVGGYMGIKAVGILGTGSYVPEKIITNHELEKSIDTTDHWIIERTGIKERRVIGENEATSDLAIEAAKRAIVDAGITVQEIDLIIVATITPDFQYPPVSCLVKEKLKAVNAAAFDLTAVCTGFIYGLITGSTFIQAGTYKKVLVIGAESLSTITDWTDRNTAILFGDGAGAVILGETKQGYGILGSDLGAEGAGGDLLKVPAGGSRLPASLQTVKQHLHFIQMDGNEVFRFAVKIMGETAMKAIEKAGISLDAIDFLVPHQANLRIIQSAARRLKMPIERVVINLDKYGNTSAASIPIALDEAVRNERIKKGDHIVLVGFGGGLTWGASVIKWYK